MVQKLPRANELLERETKRILNDLENKDERKKIAKRLSGPLKFAVDPVLYAEGAIKCIIKQLETVQSPKRKLKLERKLIDWQKALKTLKED